MAGLEGDRYHPVNFAFTTERGGPSSDGTPDPKILGLIAHLNGRVVDVGSGDGRYTRHMLDQGLDVVAVDKNAVALRTLTDYRAPEDSVGRLSVVKTDVFRTLPFEDEIFDGAVSTAIQHLRVPEDMADSVTEIHRVLRPNGLLVVDLSTDITRTDRSGNDVSGPAEAKYSYLEGFDVLGSALRGRFEVQGVSTSQMDLDLKTESGLVNLKTRKINVLARKI